VGREGRGVVGLYIVLEARHGRISVLLSNTTNCSISPPLSRSSPRLLYQIHIFLLIEASEIRSNLRELPDPLKVRMADVCNIQYQEGSQVVVGCQREISTLLTKMGLAHGNEVSPLSLENHNYGFGHGFDSSDRFLTIDMALSELKTAVNVVLPSQYVQSEIDYLDPRNSIENTGQIKMKHRITETLGWKVVQIPWIEWEGRIRHEPQDVQIEYLWNKLGRGAGGAL
jgi:hypothetical protein